MTEPTPMKARITRLDSIALADENEAGMRFISQQWNRRKFTEATL